VETQGQLGLALEAASYVEVAVEAPLYTTLSYRVPAGLKGLARPGVRVLVSLRGRAEVGIVVEEGKPPQDRALEKKILDLGDVLDAEPVIDGQVLELIKWMTSYYLAPVGEVIKLALPVALRVTGERRVSLAEAGRKALEAGVVLDPTQRRLLQSLQLLGAPVLAESLREQLKGLTYVTLGQCEQAGWVESSYSAEESQIKVKTEQWVSLRRDPYADERLGERQIQVLVRLQALEFGESVRVDDLRQEVFQVRAALKSLESRGIVALEEREVYRDPFAEAEPARGEAPELMLDQVQALGTLKAQLEAREFRTFLLHGVTGSGKTEVYMRLIAEAMAQGRSSLVLLPEISLTPQFVAVFRGRFGDRLAVLHSGLSGAQRYDAWRRLRRGEVQIAIGARSALFAPMVDLGVVIVDEEHDGSFKQESGCRYHARDMAQLRGRLAGAVVVLGSATPSVETYYNARQGRVGYLPMSSRVAERQLPGVEIVDMRGDRPPQAGLEDPGVESFSPALLEAIGQTLDAREQTILFLNRRGFSPFVQCNACGYPMQCRDCSVSMTFHKKAGRLRCHYCDHSVLLPEKCPRCGAAELRQLGAGTERLEGALKQAFPDARVGRLDRDTGYGTRMATLIRRFRDHEIDILLGTQMVTKGHDFHNVTLVGVILADLGLNFPDFRAGERTFQLLAQVSGRAGRGEKPGKVLIQTWSPWHYALEAARHHSYSEFVRHEMQVRSELSVSAVFAPGGAAV
jgi:primosomal protein N' (replication factor Y)